MKTKRAFLVPALLGLILSACGGGETPASTPESSSETPVSQVSSAEPQSSQAPSSSEPVSSQAPSSESSSEKQSEVAKYTVTFKDENGTVLESKKWEEGSTPSYSYSKQDTDEWDYTVDGWAATADGEVLAVLPAVSADATYFAKVSKVKKQYTITFDSNGGSVVASVTEDYGTSIQKPTNPTKDGYNFVAWSTDTAGNNKVEWPLTLTSSATLYANWNEKVDIKAYLKSLTETVIDPYFLIPEELRQTNSQKLVTASQVNYDFTNFVNVDDIVYGGFGEQWHMVLSNVEQTNTFLGVYALCEAAIGASVVLFNNYLDKNPSDTASHSLSETDYNASISFKTGILSYSLQLKTPINIPLFGSLNPQIDMTYNIETASKHVRVQINDANVMACTHTPKGYSFAYKYGLNDVIKQSYYTIQQDNDSQVSGHIYESIKAKDKEVVPAYADFYINTEYTAVVGNKASGIPGFSGYICELYKTEVGKLLGYEIREEFTKWGISAKYHTLWFNLNDISNINNVKAIKNDESTYGLGGNNNHNIFLNNSTSVFEPTYNTKIIKTSRKYDVELRKQYFYGYVDNELVEYETVIPMMFIQADHDSYHNYTDFPTDIANKSGINAQVTLSEDDVALIEDAYALYVDTCIANKTAFSTDVIDTFIGNPTVIE